MKMSHAIFWGTTGIFLFAFGVFRVAMAAARRTSASVGPVFLIAGLVMIIYAIVCAVQWARSRVNERRPGRAPTA